MVVRVVPWNRLGGVELAAWDAVQQARPELASPFFRPEFTEVVTAARGDVEVAVVEGEDGPGFLPFHRRRRDRGLPIGSRLSDYQGVVAPATPPVSLRALIGAAGLRSFECDGLLASQAVGDATRWIHRTSWVLDLSGGFDAYLQRRRDAGTDQLDDLLKQRDRLERALGSVRFEACSDSTAALEALTGWKSEQYRRTGAVDVFEFPWVRDLVRRLHRPGTDEFAGMLSTLHAGEHLVAAHFGLRSSTVWHYWFPGYDLGQRRYSPGLVLLLEMARAAHGLGLRSIDLGKGDALYKRRLADAIVPLAAGTVRVSRVGVAEDAVGRALQALLARTPLAASARRRATTRRLA